MAEAIVTNIFSIAVMIIIMLGVFIQKPVKNEVHKAYVFLLFAATFSFIINVVCEVYEGNPSNILLAYVLEVLTYVGFDFVYIGFTLYLAALIGKDKKIARIILNVVIVIAVLRTVLIIILTITGKLFTLENGYYEEKELANIPYYITSVSLIVSTIVTIIYRKYLSKFRFVTILVYEMFPIIPVIVETFSGIYYLSSASMALSILLAYVLVQVDEIKSGQLREVFLKETSLTDMLTKVNNRRAYLERIESLSKYDNIGVIFGDINGLKHVNDNFGHIEGDLTIKKFADLLVEVFDRQEVFRISGDEFVVVTFDISAEKFNSKVEKLTQLVGESNSIAAFGYAYGSGANVKNLTKEAETEMYKYKNKYHEKTGITR